MSPEAPQSRTDADARTIRDRRDRVELMRTSESHDAVSDVTAFWRAGTSIIAHSELESWGAGELGARAPPGRPISCQPSTLRRGEELGGVAILKSQLPRETRVLAARSDVEALRRIEPMPLLKDDAKPRKRRAAPAHRRTRRMGTVLDLDRHAEELAQPGEHAVGISRGHRTLADLGNPRQTQERPAVLRIPAQDRSSIGRDLDVIVFLGNPAAGAASQQHAITPDDQRAIDERGLPPAL